MNYWIIATLGYLVLAISFVIDKYLLKQHIKNPMVFSFYVGIAGPIALILAPFGLHGLPFGILMAAFISGALFTFASFFLYAAMAQTSVSRILPILGGLIPLFTLFLAYVFLGERLSDRQLLAFVFLVFGAILISLKKQETSIHLAVIRNSIAASFLFALSFVMSKYVYNHTDFVSGLIWTRIGVFLGALSYLIPPQNRRMIATAPGETRKKNIFIYYLAHGLGAIGGLLQNYAVAIGSVIIVNALQGTQFMFLLLMTTVLSIYFPKIIHEKVTQNILLQKIMAIVLITIGLYFL